MEITYDLIKNARNIELRNLGFDEAVNFDFQTAIFKVDDRFDYAEIRHRALGFLGDRLHALIFVETIDGIRIISFRKANKREVKQYEKIAQP